MATYQKHCPGCFELKHSLPQCPRCGYDESAQRSPLFLPHGVLLGGSYRTGRVLGRPGGFGITYLGWDVHLQNKVAIKEYLPRDYATRGAGSLEISTHGADDRKSFDYGKEQFLKEARIVAKFDQANVVRVRAYFNANGTAYMVMPYYDGMSLGDYLTHMRNKIEPEVAVPLLLPIMDALLYVHERGVVHRDVKPANVYLASVGRPILLDFGAARHAMGDQGKSFSVVLTEGYAPLEQYQRRSPQGPYTDVYGLAATMYRTITGQAPPVALDRLGNDPLAAGEFRELPEYLRAAFAKGLAVRPSDRYQSLAEFRAGLTATAEGIAGFHIPAHTPGDAWGGPGGGPSSRPSQPMSQPASQPASQPISRPFEPISGPVSQTREPISAPKPAVSPPITRPREPVSARPPVAPAAVAPPAQTPVMPVPEYLPPGAEARVEKVGENTFAGIITTPRRPRRIDLNKLPPPLRYGFSIAVVSAAVVAALELFRAGSTRPPVPEPIRLSAPAAAPAPAPAPAPAAPPSPAPELRALDLPQTASIPGGEFLLGDSEGIGRPNESPATAIRLKPFKLGLTEVTVSQFREFVRRSDYGNPDWQLSACVGAPGASWEKPGYSQGEGYPVVCVSWADAAAYTRWLSAQTGQRFRLPTEAEWEYAARAGSTSAFWWGRQPNYELILCAGCRTPPPVAPLGVRTFAANPLGLYEISGNVREWTCSFYERLGSEAVKECGTPLDETRVVVRGGSWRDPVDALRTSYRTDLTAGERNNATGFRVVQEIAATP